ncbi:hypothetical protein BJ322DRAFT_1110263 [Thelephora terrestris]|uniref:Uncharacterized protein n=1 Tax=Thelephora terrestris TaxID=56493 RepID=A0A9P6HBV0_9AGAM|nr:hypothetical protein BJ322DRAFT_1110263 [Thelephora terrestris]
MVAPFLLQNTSSQLSLPPGDSHHKLKSKVSISSLANAMRKKEFLHQSYPALPKHYTKAYGQCTLSLNTDHEASSGLPVFSNGAVISGSLEISRISKMLQSIQIMVTGRIIVQDLGGAGTGESTMFSHTFYEWSREYNSSLPPTLIPLSYPLPTKYTDHTTGFEHKMPPTYKARLNTAVPGLRVKVQYDLSAKIVRSRRGIPFLTKTTRIPPVRRFTSFLRTLIGVLWLHAPFIYRPKQPLLDRVALPLNSRFRPGTSQSRPSSAHSTHKGHNNGRTQNVFVYTSPSLRGERATEIKLYLPHGQVCALDEPIPFVIKVFAADHVLEELHSSVPPVTNPKDNFASFHPISPDPSMKVKRPRTSSGKIKLKVELTRTTKVDAKCVQSTDSTNSGTINGTQTLSEGVIERLTRGSDWIAWSGVVVVPDDVKCGGFAACRVEVLDQLVVSILPTSSSKSPVISFCESVPVRLATRNMFGAFGGSASTIKGMEYYPPPPTTSSSVGSKTSWVSSDGTYC